MSVAKACLNRRSSHPEGYSVPVLSKSRVQLAASRYDDTEPRTIFPRPQSARALCAPSCMPLLTQSPHRCMPLQARHLHSNAGSQPVCTSAYHVFVRHCTTVSCHLQEFVLRAPGASHAFKDYLLAKFPGVRPLLSSLCQPASLRVEAYVPERWLAVRHICLKGHL